MVATNAINSTASKENVWLFDTGASHHLMSGVTNITQYVPYFGNDGVLLINVNFLLYLVYGIRFSNHITSYQCVSSLENLLHTLYVTSNLHYV